MTRCIATLGAFDARGDGWLLELDADGGRVRERLHFDPPAPLRVPGKGFTGAATLPDGRLAVSGAAAIHVVHREAVVETWACPSFNDLHGLAVSADRIWVANTGLDAIDLLDPGGRFVGSHAFDPHWLNARRMAGETPTRADWPALLETRWRGAPTGFEPEPPPGEYYRSDEALAFSQRAVRDRVHPNHITIVGGRPWVTCLALSAVVDAVDFATRARFDSPPHDGILVRDAIWFTRVDGVVEARDAEDPCIVVESWDVSASSGVVGWCRGLHVTDDMLWVGFTEMRRPARFHWDRAPLDETRTAVVCLDRRSRKPLHVFDLNLDGRQTKVGALVGGS